MKSRDDVEKIVDKILTSLVPASAQDPKNASREVTPGWSSLIHIEIFFALEEEFQIRFDEDSMAFAESRDDLVENVMTALQL